MISYRKVHFVVSLIFATAFMLMLGASAFAASSDFNGNGRDDVIASYDYGSSTTRIWGFSSNGVSFAPQPAWISARGAFDAGRTKVVAGNFNGAGADDVAALYDYGNGTSRLWLYASNGATLTPTLAWYGPGFNASRAKMVAGDFNGDGTTDVAMLYDYGNATSRIWLFLSNGTTMTPTMAWYGPGFDAGRAKIAAGNFNGAGPDDIAVLYDYGSTTSRIWTFISNGSTFTPSLAWAARGFEAPRAKIVAGNFDGSGADDIAALYDYGSSTSRIWTFISNGTTMTPSLAWGSPSFDANKAKLVAGNFDGAGADDVATLYDYGSSTSRLWMFASNGTTLAPHQAWASGTGNWDSVRSKIANSAVFLPRAGVATGKAIDVNLSTQTLNCNQTSLDEVDEGVFRMTGHSAFMTLVSSGRSPFDTPTGNFQVYAKDPVADMSGFAGTAEEYYVPNVPYILWFFGSYSIHGAYWHNDFGNVRSHGCVNVPVDAGAWIYAWAPIGTPVNVHY